MLLLVLPSIIINTISYFIAVRDTKKEISNTNFEQLRLAENTLKQLEKNVVKDSFRLSINSSINKLNNLSTKIDLTSSKDIETVSHILDTLSDLVAVNSEYQSIYLYLEDFNYTFTSNIGAVKNELLKDSLWLKYYSEHKSKKTILTMQKSVSDNVITYIYPLILSTNLNGALIINIKEDMIGSIINNSNYNTEDYIFIISSNGQVIVRPNSRLLPQNVSMNNYIKGITEMQASQGYIIRTVNENQLITCYMKSDFNNWTFISVSSAVPLSDKVNELRNNTIYRTLAIIVVEILAAFLISIQLNAPLSRYIKNNKTKTSAFFILLNTLINTEEAPFISPEKNKVLTEDNYFQNIIYKDSLNEVDKTFIRDKFKYDSFICIIISIDKYDDFVMLDFEQQKNINSFIYDKLGDVLKVNFPYIKLEGTNNELVFIINIDKASFNHGCQESLKSLLDDVKEEIKRNYTNTITIGIGSLYYGIGEVKKSYLEAQSALIQKFKLGYDNTIMWKEDFKNSTYYYPFKLEERLLSYLYTQSEKSIILSLNELVDDLTGRSNLSSENIKQIFAQLIGKTIVRYIQEKHLDIHHILGNNFDIYTELAKKETIYEVKDWLEDVFTKTIQYFNNANHCNKDSLDLIIKYITENYKKDIGITDISEAVGLSYSHVRKVFKDELGKSIVDYMNAMRIMDAKQLLSTTDLSIKNIAVNLGYNNDQSFTRFFKKIEGMTPGEYRTAKTLTVISD
jgi:AraC-like DNA-binding protein